jgi:lysophospholipase L1-like esterase
MTKQRFALFATATVILTTVAIIGALFSVDYYLHYKYADLVGLNVWGYRGPAVGRKAPNEWRLAVLGESTAFGYGVNWRDALPAQLERALNAQSEPRHAVVLNLAYNNQGAYSYTDTLNEYRYLNYDAVLFYSGYNDLAANFSNFRHDSVVFRLTGYLPIFPMIFQEKAMAIRWGGHLEDAYWGRKTTFRPDIAQRATAGALEAAVSISRSLDAQLADPAVQASLKDAASEDAGDCGEWAFYCSRMAQAMKVALDGGTDVLMVTQPYISGPHRRQQELLHAFLERRFPGDPHLHFANMGDTINLKDLSLAFDGMHLTARGNRIVADAMVPYVRDLIR